MRLVVRDVKDFQVITPEEAEALVRFESIVICDDRCSSDREQVYHPLRSWQSFTRDLELVKIGINIANKQTT